MATARRNANATVESQLRSKPYRFSFFQAVRLLELEGRRGGNSTNALEVGYDHPPERECVHFKGIASHQFPSSEIASLEYAQPLNANDPNSSVSPVPKMGIAFMGLYGPAGVLPRHDTQRIIDAGKHKNVEKDLLDIFNHRVLSLFFRAWAKYRLPLAFERTYAANEQSRKKSNVPVDTFTLAFLSLPGMGSSEVRQRQEIPDEFSIEFSGLFSQKPKNAVSLQRMIQSYFEIPCQVQQFAGQWLRLGTENRSEMPTRTNHLGQNCQLGVSFIVGDRIWDIQSKFRVKLGPVDAKQFSQLLPGSRTLIQIAQVIRQYAGPQYDFDIQIELLNFDVGTVQLSGPSKLGQNMWLFSKPVPYNPTDAIFTHQGYPVL